MIFVLCCHGEGKGSDTDISEVLGIKTQAVLESSFLGYREYRWHSAELDMENIQAYVSNPDNSDQQLEQRQFEL